MAAACDRPPPGPRGLEPRVPVARFLSFPPDLGDAQFRTVEAYPRVRFDWAVRAVPAPRTRRYFVIEREGKVWSFPDEPATQEKVLALDLSRRTQGYYDCGLLGLAFHPHFGRAGAAGERHVFLWYNYSERPQGSREQRPRYRTPSFNRLARFDVRPGGSTLDPASERVLIDQYNETTFHEGGAMFFHPEDGFLYLTLGDDFNPENAQRIDRGLFSGVIRIDVDQDPARSHPIRRRPRNAVTAHYSIPDDNPFADPAGAALEEFWALGLRSPHSMSLDRVTGRVFIADVGHMEREELDLLAKGANFEWPFREGGGGGEPSRAVVGLRTPPVYDYAHADGDNCIIGGVLYRGRAFPELQGRYVFGDNGSNRVWELPLDGGRAGERRLLARLAGPNGYVGGLSSVGEGADGELLLTRVGPRMALLRLARGTVERAPVPALLSETGLFADVATLAPAPGVLPYEVNVPQWADGARLRRFIAVPSGVRSQPGPEHERIAFSPVGEWTFPKGTVLAQHLELPIDARRPELVKRLETRVLVHGRGGDFYALSYAWRDDGSDAELTPPATGYTYEIEVVDAEGRPDLHAWHYPSRSECRECHNSLAGGVLGVNARQLNRDVDYARARDNQLRAWSHAGLFREPLAERHLRLLPRVAPLDDARATLEHRVRSYLDVNCAACHRPQGARAAFDARFATPLRRAGLLDEPLDLLGMQGARVVKPGDPGASLLLLRLHSVGAIAMPPVAKRHVDRAAVETVTAWIERMR